MRILVTILVSFIGAYASFHKAFYGLIGYAFWAYTYPEHSTWGLLPMKGFGFIMGFILVLTTLMQRKKICSYNPKILLILGFLFLCWLAVFTSGSTDESTWQFQYFVRAILITLIITLLVDSVDRFYEYSWAIAIFFGFDAALEGFKGILTGYAGGAKGGFGGVLNDRNFMAVFLCAIIPIVFYLGNTEKIKRLKLFSRFLLIGDIFALIITYCRAGFLGICAVGIFLFMKLKNKLRSAIFGGIALLFITAYFIPQAYVDRIQTIQKFDHTKEEADTSAVLRLMAWRSALKMMKDNPLTGVGFYNSANSMPKYPDPVTGTVLYIATHNSLLQVGAEIGFPGLILYILIFFTSYRTLGKLKKKTKLFSLSANIEKYTLMLQAAFVGFFVSGFFVNAAYIDMPWHLVGLTMALEQITNKEIEEKKTCENSLNVA